MRESGRVGPADAETETWQRKLTGLLEAARRLFSTRAALFNEELGEKATFLGKGCAGLSLALGFVVLALLLFTAFIAALFTSLLGGPVAGIAAALGLHLLIAALVGWFGARQMSKVKPFEFPVTSQEIRKDLDALRAAACPEPPTAPEERAAIPIPPGEASPPSPSGTPAADDFEERFRAGSE